MTILAPMSDAAFPSFLEETIALYAKENVLAGRWPEKSALDMSQADFARLLPDGFATADNFFFEILDPELKRSVGSLWYLMRSIGDEKIIFISYIVINPEF